MSQIPSFASFAFNKQILNAIAEVGYTSPTAIQSECISVILAGQDVVGIAPTGTGKTAAYLLPIIKLLSHPKLNFPRALIIVPTRELTTQVQGMFARLANYTGLRITALYGAVGAKHQIANLVSGTDVIVGTPGRVHQLYMEGHLILKHVKHFVLDEAEKLMDRNFTPQLHALLEVLPRKRQHLLFSATMSPLVQKIMLDFITFPYIVHIDPQERTAPSVTQVVYHVPNLKTKLNLIMHLLHHQHDMTKVIIFCKSKNNATQVHKYFTRKWGDQCARLVHGNKTQQSRINALHDFSHTEIRLLITTDVAARGIDIEQVTHVINFDTPVIYEDYIHRIGRTGRAFHTGHSITLCSPADEYHLQKIQQLIKQNIPVLHMPPQVVVESTTFQEQQDMLRQIDFQKRKENPQFKGAFHDKKVKASRK